MKKNSLWVMMVAALCGGFLPAATTARAQEKPATLDELIAGLRTATVAAVCDAVDQVTGRRGFMEYDMRPLAGENPRIVGPAVTALIVPAVTSGTAAGAAAKPPLAELLLAVDGAPAGSVLVVAVKEDRNITGIGGLLATTCTIIKAVAKYNRL